MPLYAVVGAPEGDRCRQGGKGHAAPGRGAGSRVPDRAAARLAQADAGGQGDAGGAEGEGGRIRRRRLHPQSGEAQDLRRRLSRGGASVLPLLRWGWGSRSPRLTLAAASARLPDFMQPGPFLPENTLTPSAPAGGRQGTGPITHSTLENGLQIVVIPDHRTPVVTHMVWYQSGSADDPPGKSGIAHFLEHLMFKGTKAHPKGFSDLVAELGGQENAFTAYDYTAYFQRVAKEHLATMMGFEADRMTGLVLTDD